MPAPDHGRLAAITLAMALAAAALMVQSSRGYGQETASKAKDEKGKWVPLFERHAAEYKMRVGKDADVEARMLAEPLLRLVATGPGRR